MALTKKQIEDEAYKVIRGEYGNGEARKSALGENYSDVQAKVNELSKKAGGASNVKAPSSSNATKSTSANVKTSNATSSKKSSSTNVTSQNTNKTSSSIGTNKAKTSSTANDKNNSYSTKQQRNQDRAENGRKVVDKKIKSTNKQTETKQNEIASSIPKETGVVKTLSKNTIELQKVDGTTKQVKTYDVQKKDNTSLPRLNTKADVKLSDDDYKTMGKILDNVGETPVLRQALSANKDSKDWEKKYGVSYDELLKSYKEQKATKDKEWGDKHPVLSTASTMLEKVLKTPFINSYNTTANIINPNGELTKASNNYARSVNDSIYNKREGATSDLGNVGKSVYNVGTNVGERLASTALSNALFGTAVPSAVLNGMNTAGDILQSAQDRGIDNRKAAIQGLVGGSVDSLLSVKGLESIKALKDSGSLAKDIAKSGVIGGGEQGITYAINEVTDLITNGEDSVYSNNKRNYLAQGMSEKDATTKAVIDEIATLGEQVGTGALFGAGMKGASKALGATKNLPFLKKSDANLDSDTADTRITEQNPTSDNSLPDYVYDELPPETQARLDAELDYDIRNLLLGLKKSNKNSDIDNGISSDTIKVDKYTNNSLKGDAEYGRTEQAGEINRAGNQRNIRPEELISEREANGARMGVVGDEPRENGRTVGLRNVVGDDIRELANKAGITDLGLKETTESVEDFSKQLESARKSSANGHMVSSQSPEELIENGARLFSNDDRTVGFAIEKDGNIVAVHKNPSNKTRGAVNDMIISARENGGTKMDCYGDSLVNMYMRDGFIPVAKVEWNEKFKPDDWQGEPKDVYVMMKDSRTTQQVLDDIATGNHPIFDAQMRDSLPVFGGTDDAYDNALNYRDRLLAGEKVDANEYASLKNQKITPTDVINSKSPTNVEGISQHYETLKNSPMFKDAESMQKLENAKNNGVFGKDIQHRTETMNEAAKEYASDPERVRNEILNKPWTEGGKDFDKSMCILHDVLNEEGDNTTVINQYLRNQSEKLTNAGRELRAVQDYVGTKEGTLQKSAQYMQDKAKEVLNKPKFKSMDEKFAKECIEGNFDSLQYRLGMDADNIKSIQDAIANGSDANDIVTMIATWQATGRTQISSNTLNQISDIFNQIEEKNLPLNSRARAKLEQQAYAILADEIGGKRTFGEMWNSWRYLAMLGNVRTHLRNIFGNTTHYMVTEAKDNIASVIEDSADKINRSMGGEGIARTKSMLNRLSSADNELISLSRIDADTESYRLLNDTGSKYNDIKGEIESNRKAFTNDTRLGKFLNFLNEKNSNALDLEDYWGLKNKYSKSLARYLKANGADESIFRKSDDASRALLSKAREYAIDEAKQATFHSYSKVADALATFSSSLKNGNIGSKAVHMGLEGLLPFKKTPINILKQGIKYSPVSLAKAVADGMDAVKTGRKGASDVIEDLASGLTGTGIMALGGLLASQGLLNGNANENYNVDNAETAQGKQNYALQIGDKSYTLDWLAPASLPLFVGVELYNNMTSDEDVDSIDSFINALTTIGEPVTEMSMLQGINDVLGQLKNGVGSALATLGTNVATNYVTQGVPTLFGQVARSIDPIRRSTYVDKGAGMEKQLERQALKMVNKIPGLSQLNEPYIDAKGETQENVGGNLLGRLAYNMLSPGFYQNGVVTNTDRELNRVYEATNEPGVYSGTSDGKVGDSRLSREDYTKYQTMYGKNNREFADLITSSGIYAGMDDGDKAELIKNGYNLSKKFADYEIGGKNFTSKKDSELYDVYKEGGMSAVADFLTSGISKNNEAETLGFLKSDGNINTDRLDKVKEIFEGNSDDVEMYGKAMKGYLDSTGDSLNANTSYKDIIGYLDSTDMSPEEKGKIILGTKTYDKLAGEAKTAYDENGYAGLYEYYQTSVNKSSKKKSSDKITTTDVNTSTSATKTIPSPSDLGKTASTNMIEQNGKSINEQRELIENTDMTDFTTDRGKGTVSFNQAEGLPMLDKMYKTDAEKSQAIINSGVSTKGVEKTRATFGDDYVYAYYNYKQNADTDGNGYVKKDELTSYLKSQGMSDAEIAQWWNVFKK